MPLIQDDHLPNMATLHMSQTREIPTELRIKNRRKRYLESHPEYFGTSLELADPLLYDRLIRHHQTPAERESEVRKKGYAGTLEADLFRGEAKLEQARTSAEERNDGQSKYSSASTVHYQRATNGEITALEMNEDGSLLTKDEAHDRWREVMRARFLAGMDEDFDYRVVDDDEGYDDRRAEDQDREDDYFDDETPEAESRTGDEGRSLEGETGVQDF